MTDPVPLPSIKPSIMLNSGNLFDLERPNASTFTLQDIAHALGHICRFTGHVSRFYSVAEHCVHVARLVPIECAQAALLHDASEAFLGDVSTPLKALMPDYRTIEAEVEYTIYDRFLPGTPAANPDSDCRAAIKRADHAMLVTEARLLMPWGPNYWSQVKVDPADVKRARTADIGCWHPANAAAQWLQAWHRYDHLMAERAAA